MILLWKQIKKSYFRFLVSDVWSSLVSGSWGEFGWMEKEVGIRCEEDESDPAGRRGAVPIQSMIRILSMFRIYSFCPQKRKVIWETVSKILHFYSSWISYLFIHERLDSRTKSGGRSRRIRSSTRIIESWAWKSRDWSLTRDGRGCWIIELCLTSVFFAFTLFLCVPLNFILL